MRIELLTLIVGLVFVGLLLFGRSQIARGSNAAIANGAVVLVLSIVAGIWCLGLLVSWEGW